MLGNNIYIYTTNEYIPYTNKVLSGLVLVASVIFCIVTGVKMKKKIIKY